MSFYFNVATIYDQTTIMVEVHAENEYAAVSEALDVMKTEWGAGALDFSDLRVECTH